MNIIIIVREALEGRNIEARREGAGAHICTAGGGGAGFIAKLV